MSFSQLSVVITGAGQGIGFAIAKALVEQGANVLLNDFDEALALEIWHDDLHGEIDDLCRHCEVDDLLPQSSWVDVKLRGVCRTLQLLLVLRERSAGDTENVQIGNQDTAKWYVDKRGQAKRKV